MLKATPQSLLRSTPLPDFNLLDEDHPPPKWCGDWVSRRWVEGLKTLRLIPFKGAPPGFGKAWPAYAYEWQDLIAQQQQGELQATQHEQNRVRLQPSYRQVTMCEAVISWPLYLADLEPVLLAFNRVGWAYACERDATFVVASRYGGCAETHLARYVKGCTLISDKLRGYRIPVF
jgi:hypothetical protein